MKHKSYLRYFFILLLPIGILINYISSLNSKMTQYVYSNFFYQGIAKGVISLTNWMPVSIAEIIFIIFILFICYKIVEIGIKLFRYQYKRYEIVRNAILNILAISGVVYFTFIMIWGINYNRPPIAEAFNLKVEPISGEELTSMGQYFIDEANELRSRVHEDTAGVMYLEGGYKGVFERVHKGFDALLKEYPQLGTINGRPKPVLLSNFMSYTGIWGIYAPFTSEANVNISIPAPVLPSTTCHEMAHQLGFAREEEANYIAYLTCMIHPDDDFKYSGMLLALTYTLNEIYRYDTSIYDGITTQISDGVIRDLEAIKRFSQFYESTAGKAFSKSNDLYLKANRQKNGEGSYRRVVDLFLAEYRQKKMR